MNIKNKKKCILFVIGIVLLIILFIFLGFINKKGVFINLIENVSNNVVKVLSYDTISGDFDLVTNIDTFYSSMEIVTDVSSKVNYQVDLNKGTLLFKTNNNYKDADLDSNIFIDGDIYESKVHILSSDVYDKYVNFNCRAFRFLNILSDSGDVIDFIVKDLNYYLDNKYFVVESSKIDDAKVKKMTLDLTGANFREVKKKFNNNLSKNKNIQKKLKTIKDYIYFDEELLTFKLSIYTTKFTNEVVKIEYDNGIHKIDIQLNDDNIHFKVYINDSYYYDGDIEVRNKDSVNKAIVVNVANVVDNFKYKFNIKNFDIEFNENINNEVDISDSIYYEDLNENTKEDIKSDEIIGEVYDNYLKKDLEESVIEESETIDNITDDNGI